MAIAFWRIMLGKKSKHADDCIKDSSIGVRFYINQDLSADTSESLQEFKQKYIKTIQDLHPDNNELSAGYACGALYKIRKEIKDGDIVLSPDKSGDIRLGKVVGEYYYDGSRHLNQRRKVEWIKKLLKSDLSESLQASIGRRITIVNISKHGEEINSIIAGSNAPVIQVSDSDVEDSSAFAMEKHLEDFLVKNWKNCPLGKNYDIYEDEGEAIGQQYETDTGPIDILAISKDKKELLVVELKKGRASDKVVGQIQRYMGFVRDEVMKSNQSIKSVRGCIIALEDDIRIKRALSVTQNIDFYRYEVTFNLKKVKVES